MIALGAVMVNNSGKTIDETADFIIAEIEKKRTAK